MPAVPDLSLILPAFNEQARIASTIREAYDYFRSRHLTVEILVAADGTDGTREAAAGLCHEVPLLTVLGSSQRRGKGHGIRQAVRQAIGKWIGFADADNKTPFTEFDKFLPLLEQGCDAVIGSRGLSESRIERPQRWYRRWGSRGFRVLLSALIGLPDIRDTQCGFKFFQAPIARDLFARQRIDGYMFDVEILMLAARAGYSIKCVPVRWRDDADSRLELFRGNLRNLLDVLKIRFGSYPQPLQFRNGAAGAGTPQPVASLVQSCVVESGVVQNKAA
ncbi:MAG TPA: dolichyl-phosphate beta-glucosyltransferase [Planctomycetaceae bacterium]